MSEDREQNVGQNIGEKERASDEPEDVEGHQQVERASGDETDEPDVEGHGFHPQTEG